MEAISNPELRTERRRVGPSDDSLVILALDFPVQTPARFRPRLETGHRVQIMAPGE